MQPNNIKANTIAISPEAVSFLVGILGNVLDGLCIPDKDLRIAKELYDVFAPLACTNANNDYFTLANPSKQQ